MIRSYSCFASGRLSLFVCICVFMCFFFFFCVCVCVRFFAFVVYLHRCICCVRTCIFASSSGLVVYTFANFGRLYSDVLDPDV